MRVIVTLTTLPTRLSAEHDDGMKSNIHSLLNQDYEDYEIHLNVPVTHKQTGQSYVMADWLTNLSVDNSKLKIFEGLEDVGAVTKLFYTIKRVEEPDAIIIVCDDDLVYDQRMVSEQVSNQLKHERTAVGYDGSRAEDQHVFPDARTHFVVSVPFDIEVNILQHYKTVSYRREWFEEDFFTDFVDKSWNDDVLVAGYMGKQGIRKLVATYEGEEKLITKEQWDAKGGVQTFPVLRHTSHEGEEGCYYYRSNSIDSGHGYFHKLGYLK